MTSYDEEMTVYEKIIAKNPVLYLAVAVLNQTGLDHEKAKKLLEDASAHIDGMVAAAKKARDEAAA